MADLTPYVSRFLLGWEQRYGDTQHQAVEGSLVFADVSGFTRLSERLAKAGGKVGAEQMTDVINSLFGDLLMVAARRGGEMLKYGGDALLLLFLGEHHAPQAAAACHEMQARLHEIGRVETGAGPVRLRMSVGLHSGTFDMFRVGTAHTELVVAGPGATTTCAMEAAADAGEILLSGSAARLLDPRVLGAAKAGGTLLRRLPDAPMAETEPVPPQPHADRFLSTRLAMHLSEGAVDPDHRVATVAFLHLIGIDDRLASQPPAEVAVALHDTMSTVQEVLHDLEVTFLATDVIANGTKVMASAGAPTAVEAGDERVLRALTRLRDAGTPLPIRAGAHRGHVFAGDVGPPFRRTYTTIGDVTNTAARVMGQATAGQVLALASVLDQVPACGSTPQPSFVAKGKAEPLVPFLVGDCHDAPERSPAAPDALPFLGRSEALSELQEGATAAAEGRGRAVEVVGDAGIGKSRLLHELAAPAMRRVVVRCEPYQRQTAYFAVRHLLAPALGVVGDLDTLRDRLAAVAPDLLAWAPLLAAVFDLEADDTPETRVLEGPNRRARTSRLVEELLDRSLDRPTLLVIEDVHWVDDASGEVLRHLETVVAARPWFLVSTRRPEPAAYQAAASISLGPLDDAEVAALIGAARRAAPLPPHRAGALAARCGGNPLFLEELLHSADADELPSSIEVLIAARIDALGGDARRMLRTAAVLGSSFDPVVLLAVDQELRVSAPDADAVRAQLAAFLDREDRRRLRFRHQLVRDVAYESLPFRERRRLHHLAGDAIESRHVREGGDPPYEVLSLHFFESGDHERAWRYSAKAGRRAMAKFANAEAATLLQRALAVAPQVTGISPRVRADLLEDLGDASGFASLIDDAHRAYRKARQLYRQLDPVGYARLCRKEARLAERAGRTGAAVRWLRRGTQALEGQTSPRAVAERARAWAMYAWLCRQSGKPASAVRWAERAIEEGRKTTNRRGREAVANAYVVLDGAQIALGRPSEANHAVKALRIFERLGALADEAVVLNNLGAHAYHRGEWDEAVVLFDRGRERNVRVGNHLEAGFGSWNICEILMDQGRVEEAEAQLAALADLWRSVGYPLGDALVDWQRGRLAARWGDPEAGLRLLCPVRDRLDAMGLVPYVVGVDAAIAECRLRMGDIEGAREDVERALALDASAGGTSSRPSLLRLRGYGAVAEGRTTDAWAAFDESLHEARTRSAAFDVALALEGFAVLAAVGAAPPHDVEERLDVLRRLGVVATPPPPADVPQPVLGASVPA